MIEYVTGDILESDAQAIVIPVNCVGVMGKGLAKQFKDIYPNLFGQYVVMCASNKMELGEISVIPLTGGRRVIFFPTKNHWRDYSSRDSIRDGLDSLAKHIHMLEIKSVAIPKLGCGAGGLYWQVVKPIIEDFTRRWTVKDCHIIVYVAEEDLK